MARTPEQERADVVAWLRGADARIAEQRERGARDLHYMHTAGMLQACDDCAKAIEAGAHVGASARREGR